MKELSPTARVILGLLMLRPRSGYDIKQFVDKSIRFFWSASYGQIYPELRRLEEAGLVEGVEEATGERMRTTYGLTTPGRQAVLDWLREPPDTFELRNEGMLKVFLADALPPVRGDRVQLQQVLSNLLRNAIDAMSDVVDRPRQLVIRTAPGADDRVTASVQDSGVGLNPAETDRLFQPFHTTKPSGMGIGLSVSRSIIENHGGCLWATPNDGPGATFSFSIPRGCSPP